MKVVGWFLQIVVSLASTTVTFLALGLGFRGVNMLGLDWLWWAIIGAGILWISLVSIIVRLFYENRKLMSKDAKQEREKRELEIEELRSKQLGTNKNGFPILF